MSRPPAHEPPPPLLRLALLLTPEARRDWIADMADELPHVPPADRGRWQRGALALALRWRFASLGTVPRPQLAVAVLTAALLVGSPWLLRRYVLQTRTSTVTTELTDEARAAGEDRRDADGPAALAEAASDEAEVAGAAPQSPDVGEPLATARQVEPEALGVADPPADPAALPAPAEAAEELQDTAARSSLRERLEADIDGTLTVTVGDATVQLTATRATDLEIRSGLEDGTAPLLDRRVEAGERFLLVLPSLVIAGDGGALTTEAFGALGPDGAPLRLGFVEGAAGSDESPP
jgi:hypothetical protein